jgi:hypothetical protein
VNQVLILPTEKIYGTTQKNAYWATKMNQIYNKLISPDIVAIIKLHRLEWLVHVVRMDSARTVKKLLEGKPRGKREREKKEDLH